MQAGDRAGWRPGPGLLEAAWRYKWLIVVCTLLSGLAAFGASLLQPTQYRAEAQLLLSDPRNTGAFRDELTTVIDPARYARNQAEFADSVAVAARVVELVGDTLNLGMDEVDEQVTVTSSLDVDAIEISAVAGEAQDAAALANAVGEAYQQFVVENVRTTAEAAVAELAEARSPVESRIAEAEAALAADPDDITAQARREAAARELFDLDSRARQISVDAALFGTGVRLFGRAEVPEEPVQPQPARNALLAAVLGLLGASAFAWWYAERTQSADHRMDAAPILQAPCLGQIPDFSAIGIDGPLPTVTAPRSSASEAYRFIVTAVEFAWVTRTMCPWPSAAPDRGTARP